jgi:hypothetical protein
VTSRNDLLLSSINARLGAMLRVMGAESDPGQDPDPFSDDYLAEIVALEQEAREAAQEPEEEPEGEPGWVQTLAAMQEGQSGFYEDDEE